MEKDNVNSEIEELFNEEEKVEKAGFGKKLFANIIDQAILLAGSALLVVIVDYLMKFAGYRFVREDGIIVMVATGVYFVLNCIYAPIMETTKSKKTIAKKILHV